MSAHRRWLKELDKLVADECPPGTEVSLTKGSHWRIQMPGRPPVFTSGSPGNDWRTIKNVRSQIRRARRGDVRAQR